MIFFGVICNTLLMRFLPKIESMVLIIHIGGFLAVLVPLIHLSPHGNAKDVFTLPANGGGWKTQELSFFVSIVTGVYSFLD